MYAMESNMSIQGEGKGRKERGKDLSLSQGAPREERRAAGI